MSSLLRIGLTRSGRLIGVSRVTGSIRLRSTDAATKSPSTGGGFDAKDEADVLDKLRQSFSSDEAAGGIVPVYKRALLYGNKVAIKDEMGEYSYSQLYVAAKKLSIQISNLCGSGSNSKVAFLCSNSALHTLMQWACWFSGQVVVPLSNRHPANVLDYYVKDSNATLLITTPEFESLLTPLAEKYQRPLIVLDHSYIPANNASSAATSMLDPKAENVLQLNGQTVIEGALDNGFYRTANAMILYTSGSTGSPKGVVLSHKNIQAQVNGLCDAWAITDKDSLLHVLPLNHVHGGVNALLCPLTVGARLTMLSRFDSATVWSTLLNVNQPSKDRINLFMAVPTIYSLLIGEYDKAFGKNSRMVEYIREQCEKKVRLMVSGSAPLPPIIFNRWHEITGHKLLERYGMTEVGMALSNPYVMDKVRDRVPGTVGAPLPGTEVKLVDTDGRTVVQVKGESGKGIWSAHELPIYENLASQPTTTNVIGELYIKGASVFAEYHNKPAETTKSFDADGWFVTGDEGKYDNGVFRILGRLSVDIIKAGGYKVSALEIETHLLQHPAVADACVVGLADMTWGQKIAAVIVAKPNADLDANALKEFCKLNLAEYQRPVVYKFVDEMPRNAMGKVNKKDIARDMFVDEGGDVTKSK